MELGLSFMSFAAFDYLDAYLRWTKSYDNRGGLLLAGLKYSDGPTFLAIMPQWWVSVYSGNGRWLWW